MLRINSANTDRLLNFLAKNYSVSIEFKHIRDTSIDASAYCDRFNSVDNIYNY